MVKRRFEVGPTPKTDHPMFKKFGMGESQSTDDPGGIVDAGEADHETEKREADAQPLRAAKPSKGKPAQEATGVVGNARAAGAQDGAFLRVQIRMGVPKVFARRLKLLCTKHGITEDYALKWLSDQSVSKMDRVDITAISPSPAALKIKGSVRHKTVLADPSLIDQFRALHDPLDAYTVEECMFHIYVAAFTTALDELDQRLSK